MAAPAARLPAMTLTATRINPPGGYENLSRLCRAASAIRCACEIAAPARARLLRRARALPHLRHAPAGDEPPPEGAGRGRAGVPAPRGHLDLLRPPPPRAQRGTGAGDAGDLRGRRPRAAGRAYRAGRGRGAAGRAASSREFFAANADKFRAQQELIAPRAQYEDPVARPAGDAAARALRARAGARTGRRLAAAGAGAPLPARGGPRQRRRHARTGARRLRRGGAGQRRADAGRQRPRAHAGRERRHRGGEHGAAPHGIARRWCSRIWPPR